jgi:predicted metalloprotease with PDZ domain
VARDSNTYLGGGMGLTNSFVMFAKAGLDFSAAEQREQFRWVLAHEYFREWNGLTLRVASLPKSDDDASVYWFSEGVTEFYTMRLLTRAGLQSPARSRDVLDDRLTRYGANSKRGLSAKDAAGREQFQPLPCRRLRVDRRTCHPAVRFCQSGGQELLSLLGQ